VGTLDDGGQMERFFEVLVDTESRRVGHFPPKGWPNYGEWLPQVPVWHRETKRPKVDGEKKGEKKAVRPKGSRISEFLTPKSAVEHLLKEALIERKLEGAHILTGTK